MPFSDRTYSYMPRREKVFGAAPGVPLDRNAKARIMVFVRAYNVRMKERGQHTGPITRAYMDVLRALLYSFHNGREGDAHFAPDVRLLSQIGELSRDG